MTRVFKVISQSYCSTSKFIIYVSQVSHVSHENLHVITWVSHGNLHVFYMGSHGIYIGKYHGFHMGIYLGFTCDLMCLTCGHMGFTCTFA